VENVRNFQGFITRSELLATLEEQYFVECISWLVHCAVCRLLYMSHGEKDHFRRLISRTVINNNNMG